MTVEITETPDGNHRNPKYDEINEQLEIIIRLHEHAAEIASAVFSRTDDGYGRVVVTFNDGAQLSRRSVEPVPPNADIADEDFRTPLACCVREMIAQYRAGHRYFSRHVADLTPAPSRTCPHCRGTGQVR